MTGLGERSHLLTKDVNLTTHITEISNVIEWENLSNVVLVAHSYGGIIASGVAERLHDKISFIVFLGAFMPETGESLLEKSSLAFVDAIKSAIAKGDAGIKAPPSAAFGVEEKDRAWVDAKTTPQPVGTYTEKAVYTRRPRDDREEDVHSGQGIQQHHIRRQSRQGKGQRDLEDPRTR
jgi:pimeloyl-ACP methyl ester carboxylesterase